ncbi:guanitoxin biosynthesis heme-dependent pre-guanitoxin N-hydroxylase GntA [Dyella sp.]|jgi:FPC/CPF motif-containing protein YcgG|uniref:guanitoxin biosynthesis heme-dependent pre-guanitoxin N-hydroxylase GntA n=1 Tax=Dyella sp. TaxID=1869338 RepID=UPI002D79F17A|nr:guanitoxin biosynthesis heme-dependent pre-guanitoxin N-hydroxylase GntA [Dyella sp.]HET6432708.1 guanitoxin biosynthesis heme-dependent pre-guanitoxin N-hydroxylase GntA [Dyella sp.]
MHALPRSTPFDAEAAFAGYIAQEAFPCLAAKQAVARGQVTFFHGSSIDCPAHDRALLDALTEFARPSDEESPFRSFVALFPDSPGKSPKGFETAIWQRLQRLHDIDVLRSPWDETVSSDPSSPDFSMSLGGNAFYVVGLHPGSTRRARRFPVTAMVFNLHRQFEQLREQDRYHRFSEAIIERDVAFHGSINPMLDEHGSSSEARQYSGRIVGDDWVCPFQPRE